MSKTKGESKVLKMVELRLIIAFVAIVLIVVTFLTVMILQKSSDAIRENSSDLVDANSKQLQYNINSYLEKVETTAALLFSDEAYYKFDATDDSLDQYTKLQSENALSNRIVDLGIMQNFSDFGIIYSDNHTVGWISNVTKSSCESDALYDFAVNHITDKKTLSGWFFSDNENLDRLYYVKRLNKNAVLLASFYTRELSNVFEIPDELSEMTIRLINDEEMILFSSIKEEIGTKLPEHISEFLSKAPSIHISEKDYIINVNTCENGWRVVCEVPTKFVLSKVISLQDFAISVAVVISALFILFGILVFLRVSKFAMAKVSDLEMQASYDGLSGVLNKITFEKLTKKKIEDANENDVIAFAITDVDHFKSVNDTLGHSYGDKVIVRTANVMKRVFDEETYIGRIGGDEFAFLINVKPFEGSDVTFEVGKKMEILSGEFLKEFAKEHKSCGVSISAGICVCKGGNLQFDDVFKKADAALYTSKEHGRNQYTFYKEGMKNE